MLLESDSVREPSRLVGGKWHSIRVFVRIGMVSIQRCVNILKFFAILRNGKWATKREGVDSVNRESCLYRTRRENWLRNIHILLPIDVQLAQVIVVIIQPELARLHSP